MNIHYIQHEPFEDLGCIRQWFKSTNHIISHTHIWENEVFPKPETIDMLIIMGGSMSAYDDDLFSWLRAEKQFISDCITNHKKVLGICLGSQLLASVLGAKVYPGPQKEIGWFPVQMDRNAVLSPIFSFFPSTFVTMHWHGDTYDLPEGATRMAWSELTPNQAFLYKDRVVGLQFHSEMTETAITGMIDESGELIKDNYVQTIEEIKAGFNHCRPNTELMHSFLDQFVKL